MECRGVFFLMILNAIANNGFGCKADRAPILHSLRSHLLSNAGISQPILSQEGQMFPVPIL